jgi:hypothetical protein
MTRADLTGYAALFGEGLTAKVDLLGRLLGDSHYPSPGQYKERLLADAIRGFLPRTVEVGTGFVMFPHADMEPPGGGRFHDPLNQSAFSMSRQCDILVYDVAKYPAIFRDRDFVIVRPEAVRAVIEVKGMLSRREVLSTLTSFQDFAVKWRTTQLFYREMHVALTLWVPKMRSHQATCEYSWRRPPSRSRLRTRTLSSAIVAWVLPSGGLWLRVRCGRWVL